MNHTELIRKFAGGATKGKASNMFIEGDTLYSYGKHFPLLVRMPWGYIQNADRYSVTTSSHQSDCRHLATDLVPFSIFNRALIYYNEIELIDKEDARYDERTYTDKNGERKTVSERRPEACVLRYRDRTFLSSMDGQNYFMTELPEHVDTVARAFECLVPDEIEGRETLRQGEWFFCPVDADVKVKVRKIEKGAGKETVRRWDGVDIQVKKVFRLLVNRNSEPHHYATEYGDMGGREVVRGTVRHSEGDHPMLRLGNGKGWYVAYESKHVQSWGAGRRID